MIKKIKILGFDISSTTLGYSVLSLNEETKEIEYISTSYIKPIKDGTILERIRDTRDKIKKIIEEIKPDEIAIEEIIMFVRNRSTAQTVITLATFNRMIGLLSFDYLGKPPSMYSVIGIRHALKLTPNFPDKEEMPEIVAKHLKIKFPYQINKKGNIKVESYDMADAICVALMHAFVLTGKTEVKEKKKKVRKKKKK